MADINVEMLREKLYNVASALFRIGETCVDVSKEHISETDALDKIRNYLYDTDVIGSRLRVDKLIAECMEPQVCNIFGNQHEEWLKTYWDKWIGLESPTINYPDCCDGCSNNPKNGGSGICNCTLPYMQNPTNYTVGTGGYVYTTTSLPDTNSPSININEAVERARQYEKR
jgi:hypothetical protein